MTYDELRAAMLSGRETSVNPGPRPVLAGTLLHITMSTLSQIEAVFDKLKYVRQRS